MDKSIKQCVFDNENAKAYLAAIGKQFPKIDKAEIGNPLALVCFESNLVDIPSHTWWLDTGATIQITNSLHEFRSSRKPNERELMVNMGNRVKVEVEHIGLIMLPLSSGHVLELNDVVYIPSIRRNLISVSILDRCGYTFHFGSGRVHLYFNSLLVGSGTLSDGLYMVDLHSDFSCLSSEIPSANVVVGSKRAYI